jgi:hypothetical protein
MQCGLHKITFCGLVNSFWRAIINGTCYLLERKHRARRPGVDAEELEICVEVLMAWHAIGCPHSGWIASRYLDNGTWAKCSRGRIVVYRPRQPARDMTVLTFAQIHDAPLAIPAPEAVALQRTGRREGRIGVRQQLALPAASAAAQLPSPAMLLGDPPITPAEAQTASSPGMRSTG